MTAKVSNKITRNSEELLRRRQELVALLRRNAPPGPFQPYVRVVPELGRVVATFQDAEYYEQRISPDITLHLSMPGNDIVGCSIRVAALRRERSPSWISRLAAAVSQWWSQPKFCG